MMKSLLSLAKIKLQGRTHEFQRNLITPEKMTSSKNGKHAATIMTVKKTFDEKTKFVFFFSIFNEMKSSI